MLPYRDSRITILALIVFFILVALYAYFEASDALFGPRIILADAPVSVSSPFITLKGQAEHIAELRLNGTPIPVTEEGVFEEPYLLAEGFNRIVLEAKDQYGRETSQTLSIRYVPLPDTTPTEEASASTSTTEVLLEDE